MLLRWHIGCSKGHEKCQGNPNGGAQEVYKICKIMYLCGRVWPCWLSMVASYANCTFTEPKACATDEA